jgi:hypothetical protein
VTFKIAIRREAESLSVFVEPVREQIVAAPVARVARRDPVEPLEIAARIRDRSVVALRDGVASERDL